MTSIFNKLRTKFKSISEEVDPRTKFWSWVMQHGIKVINNDKDLVNELKRIKTEECKGEERTMALEIVNGTHDDWKPLNICAGFGINNDGTVFLLDREEDFTLKWYCSEDMFFEILEGKVNPEVAFWCNRKHVWGVSEDLWRDIVIFTPIIRRWGKLFEYLGSKLKQSEKVGK